MQYENQRPIYIQLMELIKKEIAMGKWKVEEKMPSTREMAKIAQVNPNTVSRVYALLEQDGFLTTRRGLGTYVSNNIDKEKLKKEIVYKRIEKFLADVLFLGFSEQEICQMILEKKGGF